MNNLTNVNLNVLRVESPVIEFNYEAVKAELQAFIDSRKGIVIQEQDVPYAKEQLAYLNKLKKAIDDFRKTTKTEVSRPVKVFEEQCKELTSIIDELYSELKQQYDEFEEKRRQDKLNDVNNLIKFAREESGLPEKYQLRLEIKNEYLNKTMSMKKISVDIEKTIDTLKQEWTIEKNKIEQIETYCQLATAAHSLTFPLDPKNFMHLELESAKEQIEQAGIRAKEKQEEAVRKLEEQARIKAEREAKAQAECEAKIEIEKAQAERDEALKLVSSTAEQIEKIIPVESEEPKLLYSLKVRATTTQIKAMYEYFNQVGIEAVE